MAFCFLKLRTFLSNIYFDLPFWKKLFNIVILNAETVSERRIPTTVKVIIKTIIGLYSKKNISLQQILITTKFVVFCLKKKNIKCLVTIVQSVFQQR